MQLKWLRLGFRGCRGMFWAWVALGAYAWIGSRLPRTPKRSRPTAVVPGPEGRLGGSSALVRRTYSHLSGGLGATEERREFSRVQRRPSGRVASVRLCTAGGTACSVLRRHARSCGGSITPCAPVVGAQMAASDPS